MAKYGQNPSTELQQLFAAMPLPYQGQEPQMSNYLEYWYHRLVSVARGNLKPLPGGVFYKYRNFGSENSETNRRLKRMIANQEVYFAKPSQFNDPFDCHPRISVGYSLARYRRWVEGIVAQNPNSATLTPRVRRNLVDTIMKQQSDSSARNQIFRNIVDAGTAVFSMSNVYDSLLQWSYYAGSHTGLCLRYKITGNFCGSQLYGVEYARNRHIVDIIKAGEDGKYRSKETLRSVTTKARDWQHEKETRAIRVSNGLFQRPKSALTGIIFGLRTDPANKQLVQNWVAQAGLPIDFYDMADNPTNFGLHRTP